MLILFSLASCIWSFGFGMLFIQHQTGPAHFWRSFGIFGTVLYMVSSQCLISKISGISKRARITLDFISLLGWPVYALAVQPNQTIYFMSRFGMTYKFMPGVVNCLYSGYFLLVSANILGVIVYMIRASKLKRIQTFGKNFLVVTILILLGTVLDMIFPAVGLPAIPGSDITHFWGYLKTWRVAKNLSYRIISM